MFSFCSSVQLSTSPSVYPSLQSFNSALPYLTDLDIHLLLLGCCRPHCHRPQPRVAVQHHYTTTLFLLSPPASSNFLV